MTYPQAVQFLYELRLFGMKLGLENTRRLAATVGNPHLQLRFIHVAGTNGKGSTCAMLESIYRAAGLRVGLFTSPHLVSFAERIQVNRQLISPEDVARLTEKIREIIVSLGAQSHPTFFEAVTIMALQYFAAKKCDLVIWETGLGGRLDATNIVTPMASVITNVQLDHQKWLGYSIAEIAAEKAGIIKPGIPVVTTAADLDALAVISETATRLRSPLKLVTGTEVEIEVALAGEHQRTNAALAAAVARLLAPQIPVSESAIVEGLKTAQWAGRMQVVEQPGGRVILLDAAHNPAGAQTLAAALQTRFAGRRPALVLGAMCDKDCAGICAILAPLAAQILISPIPSERGADPHLLADLCRQANGAAAIAICSSIGEALARTAVEPFVVVTGSLHLIGDAMVELGLAASTDESGLNDYWPRHDWSSIRAVTFDVGGTLIEPWPSVGRVYAQIAERHGLHVSPDQLDRQFAAAWKARKNFGYTMADWSDLVNQSFAGLSPAPPDDALFSDLYKNFAGAAHWRVFDDVLPCLQRLKERGLKLGIISNWDERLRPLLRALKMDHYFDAIIVSGEVGRHKPDPKIFETAAAQLGVPLESILHVGDNATEDFEGARKAGLRAVLLRRGQTAAGDAIPSLDQLCTPS
ncbi:MAG TPA: HAD-IA family hydrolase [Candidatus Baltobacteraceae bacterium]|jgi:dihydrofolate synthase/folylpolyglutamate synthase|nr:HAD-IA family hydrolase [Candidatus Baltobacteraceae bacterium]